MDFPGICWSWTDWRSETRVHNGSKTMREGGFKGNTRSYIYIYKYIYIRGRNWLYAACILSFFSLVSTHAAAAYLHIYRTSCSYTLFNRLNCAFPPTPLHSVYCNVFICLIAGAVRVCVACDTVLSGHRVSRDILVWTHSGDLTFMLWSYPCLADVPDRTQIRHKILSFPLSVFDWAYLACSAGMSLFGPFNGHWSSIKHKFEEKEK